MDEKVISEEEIVDMADFFKVFGDPTRLRILFVLWENEECSVGAISEKVKMSQSAVSQQLKILRSSRLVRFQRDFYASRQKRHGEPQTSAISLKSIIKT